MTSPIGQPRIRLPATIRAGDVIDIRTLISHAMETGQRRDTQGQIVSRDIIKSFACTFDGTLVFAMDLHPSIAANPFIAFPFKAERPGTLEFTWTSDAGEERKLLHPLRVTL